MSAGDDAARDEHAFYSLTLRRLASALPAARVQFLLEYLTHHPLGARNRVIAELLEQELESLPNTPLRTGLAHRFRALRDPLLPPLSRGEPG